MILTKPSTRFYEYVLVISIKSAPLCLNSDKFHVLLHTCTHRRTAKVTRLRLPSETTVGHSDTHEQGRGIYSRAAGALGATSELPFV